MIFLFVPAYYEVRPMRMSRMLHCSRSEGLWYCDLHVSWAMSRRHGRANSWPLSGSDYHMVSESRHGTKAGPSIDPLRVV